jgi:hypothetical protein
MSRILNQEDYYVDKKSGQAQFNISKYSTRTQMNSNNKSGR